MLGDDIENKQIFTPMHNKAINLIQILILTKAIWLKKEEKNQIRAVQQNYIINWRVYSSTKI